MKETFDLPLSTFILHPSSFILHPRPRLIKQIIRYDQITHRQLRIDRADAVPGKDPRDSQLKRSDDVGAMIDECSRACKLARAVPREKQNFNFLLRPQPNEGSRAKGCVDLKCLNDLGKVRQVEMVSGRAAEDGDHQFITKRSKHPERRPALFCGAQSKGAFP